MTLNSEIERICCEGVLVVASETKAQPSYNRLLRCARNDAARAMDRVNEVAAAPQPHSPPFYAQIVITSAAK